MIFVSKCNAHAHATQVLLPEKTLVQHQEIAHQKRVAESSCGVSERLRTCTWGESGSTHPIPCALCVMQKHAIANEGCLQKAQARPQSTACGQQSVAHSTTCKAH
eukprot:4047125-Amphidinium_carterae.1